MRHISCFSALTLIASAGIASADQAPDLPTGFYLVRETECSKATEAIIQYWDWERLTVLNPVAECQLTGLSRRERHERVDNALALVGLSDRMEHYPNELSGGQQQRVAIARALIADPTLIVADEPTGDLDRTTAGEILDLLGGLNRELGKTIVMVTHDPKAASRAARLVHLEKGVLVD